MVLCESYFLSCLLSNGFPELRINVELFLAETKRGWLDCFILFIDLFEVLTKLIDSDSNLTLDLFGIITLLVLTRRNKKQKKNEQQSREGSCSMSRGWKKSHERYSFFHPFMGSFLFFWLFPFACVSVFRSNAMCQPLPPSDVVLPMNRVTVVALLLQSRAHCPRHLPYDHRHESAPGFRRHCQGASSSDEEEEFQHETSTAER